jgi:RecG-like helicase
MRVDRHLRMISDRRHRFGVEQRLTIWSMFWRTTP